MKISIVLEVEVQTPMRRETPIIFGVFLNKDIGVKIGNQLGAVNQVGEGLLWRDGEVEGGEEEERLVHALLVRIDLREE